MMGSGGFDCWVLLFGRHLVLLLNCICRHTRLVKLLKFGALSERRGPTGC
jgi:hypothetical protein